MNDYKFHKKFLCFILLIVKFGLPCHAQSSIIAEKDSTYLPADSLFARYLHSQNVAIINNNDLKLLPSGREKFNDLFHFNIPFCKRFINYNYKQNGL